MTLSIFPNNLIGITFKGNKTPVFSSRVLTARTGKEQRTSNWFYPKWRFELTYDCIREETGDELNVLAGFILKHRGQQAAFYYHDQYDDTVTSQAIGVGDGTTKDFRLVRTMGEGLDLIYYTPSISAVYIDGVEQTSGWAASASGNYGNDTITFTSAPAYGEVISADFTFYYVCRFLNDEYSFDQLWYKMWELQQLDFQTVF